MTDFTIDLIGEEAMLEFGGSLAEVVSDGVIFLKGDLGMGKTTLTRGLLRQLGHQGAVKSPTYTLVEPYQLSGKDLYHFDLYRLNDPEELEYMGIRDYFTKGSLCLVEWPDKGLGLLPSPDLNIAITAIDQGRHLQLSAGTEQGQTAISRLMSQ